MSVLAVFVELERARENGHAVDIPGNEETHHEEGSQQPRHSHEERRLPDVHAVEEW